MSAIVNNNVINFTFKDQGGLLKCLVRHFLDALIELFTYLSQKTQLF